MTRPAMRISAAYRKCAAGVFFSLCMFGVATTCAFAQAPDANAPARFLNPETMAKPPGYTHVIEVSGPHRTVYIAGQLGLDRDGKTAGEAGDFRAQAKQAFENLKAALEAVGGRFDQVVKLNIYLTDIRAHIPLLREVRDAYVNKAAPPASTTVEVPKLAREGLLIEVEAIAVLPPR